LSFVMNAPTVAWGAAVALQTAVERPQLPDDKCLVCGSDPP